jgi:hypothetical protein
MRICKKKRAAEAALFFLHEQPATMMDNRQPAGSFGADSAMAINARRPDVISL